MARIQLRDLCGVRSGDKGNISDLALFADDEEAFTAIREVVTAEPSTAADAALQRRLTEGAQAREHVRERGQERVDVGVGRRPTHRHAERSISVDAHGGEHR